jgi:hypothetical protein
METITRRWSTRPPPCPRRLAPHAPRRPAPARFTTAPPDATPSRHSCVAPLKPGRHAATHDRPPGQVVTVHVADQTITIDLDDKDSRTVRRTTAQPVRSIKAAQSRKDSRVS